MIKNSKNNMWNLKRARGLEEAKDNIGDIKKEVIK